VWADKIKQQSQRNLKNKWATKSLLKVNIALIKCMPLLQITTHRHFPIFVELEKAVEFESVSFKKAWSSNHGKQTKMVVGSPEHFQIRRKLEKQANTRLVQTCLTLVFFILIYIWEIRTAGYENDAAGKMHTCSSTQNYFINIMFEPHVSVFRNRVGKFVITLAGIDLVVPPSYRHICL